MFSLVISVCELTSFEMINWFVYFGCFFFDKRWDNFSAIYCSEKFVLSEQLMIKCGQAWKKLNVEKKTKIWLEAFRPFSSPICTQFAPCDRTMCLLRWNFKLKKLSVSDDIFVNLKIKFSLFFFRSAMQWTTSTFKFTRAWHGLSSSSESYRWILWQ